MGMNAKKGNGHRICLKYKYIIEGWLCLFFYGLIGLRGWRKKQKNIARKLRAHIKLKYGKGGERGGGGIFRVYPSPIESILLIFERRRVEKG